MSRTPLLGPKVFPSVYPMALFLARKDWLPEPPSLFPLAWIRFPGPKSHLSSAPLLCSMAKIPIQNRGPVTPFHGSRTPSQGPSPYPRTPLPGVEDPHWTQYEPTAIPWWCLDCNWSIILRADLDELREMRSELQRQITQTSGRLIRHLKSKDRRVAKVQRHCDVITAVLQASSLKRREYTR